MAKNIYHICPMKSWEAQSDSPFYIHPSLELEGFIHASTITQVTGVLDRHFRGQQDLVKLTIDTNLLTSAVKWEISTGGEEFPHIYGPIDVPAIIRVEEIH